MRGKWMIALPAALLALLAFFALPALAENEGNEAEWTVMFYMCGSDLESKHGFATGNLEEILLCHPYNVIREVMETGSPETPSCLPVNVVVQTGGSKEWHAQEVGMDIATDRLQRGPSPD